MVVEPVAQQERSKFSLAYLLSPSSVCEFLVIFVVLEMKPLAGLHAGAELPSSLASVSSS
jgi:hypothetical protein